MIQFTERAVAFVDVLGFKALVNDSVDDPPSLNALDSLVSLLGAAIPFLDGSVHKTVPKQLIPEHLYVSDCIVLSAPLVVQNAVIPDYRGLEIVVMRVIQVTQLLLDLGYLVRGGIAIGSLWHSRTNVVGPAYQEATEIEKAAVMPRVLLSKKAEAVWRSESQARGNLMCIDYDGNLMVDALHGNYIPQKYGRDISAAYGRYDSVVFNNLNAGLNANCTAKWQWMEKYLKHSQR